MATNEITPSDHLVIIPGVARSKYAKSAPKYERAVNSAALETISTPFRERNLSVEVRHFYTSGHAIDLDNLAKSILDGLKGAAYEDDSQIVCIVVRRYNISESYAVDDPRPEEMDLLVEGQDFVTVMISHT